MRRRQFLASGTALLSVALAGCAHPPVVLDMDEATACDIADEVSTTADPASEVHAVEYADLPAADRKRLDSVVPETESHSQDGYDVGVGYGTASEVGDESVFVPERRYDILVYDGNRYRVAVDSRTASEATYRYQVTEVASGVEAFADQVRDRYLFTLSCVSDAERGVVETATDGGYFEDSDAFRSVVDRIRGHEAIRADDSYGTWLLEYDGTEYLTYVEW
ncbi:hypothetical protein [Halobacterium zhouii]|uniref:hypothetical protein n=1 Tax=Halobacterium zhouii TaxID=2902624 RepID=UPI001E28931C|nr:hypothetical protein [Halobacterium zhouii]